MSVHASLGSFGAMPDGAPVSKVVLRNASGVEVALTSYGATVLSVRVPSRAAPAVAEEVTLCHATLEALRAGGNYYGSTVGRVANRIAKGRFAAGGRDFATALNNGPNTLHGGVVGFDKRLWAPRVFAREGAAGVAFSLLAHDGEEGFPGALSVSAEYELTAASELRMRFIASDATRATPVNLCNHTYWNLSGGLRDKILDHVLTLHAPFYTAVDATQIPTQLLPVAGTPMDFTAPTRIGARLAQVDGGGEPGYDHNWARARDVPVGGLGLGLVAVLHDPASGRTMTVSSTAPGVQLYTGNFLGSGPAPHDQHRALCLETQNYPDAVNRPDFPSAILSPGETYVHETVHAFTW